VNLSPVQVTRSNIVQVIKRVLADTGLPAARLEIEITEGVLMNDTEEARRVLHALSKMGIKIALDDFGTGYSSLSYVRALPLDRLKIDRSFISDLDDPTARPILQTIIDLCKTLGLTVIAEGVETDAQIKTLLEMQCDTLQGYYFSDARPAADLPKILADGATRPDYLAPTDLQQVS
jgi:EAL domain-containing protein (putative c-di-GMP-specific phosphodiesterase class I)